VPTMLAVTVYSVFVKREKKLLLKWKVMKWFYKMKITSNFILGNIIAFVVATCCKNFISVLQNTVSNFGLVPNCNWIALLIYFTKLNNGKNSTRSIFRRTDFTNW
jgi:undecaprenyl-diphosphatase